MIVKVCGLTNLDDARCAAACGADLLGFVCVSHSPRRVSPEEAGEIVRALRVEGIATPCVGVFAGSGIDDVRAAMETARFDLAQLHGGEGRAEVAQLRRPAIVARHVPGDGDTVDWSALEGLMAPGEGAPWALLLDSSDRGRLGGTGKPWPWTVAAARPPALRRLLLAGGLRPENVALAVHAARPWGVDVSSGVESRPGRKDHALLRAFVDAAHAAEVALQRPD